LWVREDNLSEFLPINIAVDDDFISEAKHHIGKAICTALNSHAGQLIGIDNERSKLREELGYRRLSCTDSTSKPDYQHVLTLPFSALWKKKNPVGLREVKEQLAAQPDFS
jgi:hypothetical protein